MFTGDWPKKIVLPLLMGLGVLVLPLLALRGTDGAARTEVRATKVVTPPVTSATSTIAVPPPTAASLVPTAPASSSTTASKPSATGTRVTTTTRKPTTTTRKPTTTTAKPTTTTAKPVAPTTTARPAAPAAAPAPAAVPKAVPAPAPAPAAAASLTGDAFDRLAMCEAGGDPTLVDGPFYGAFQFMIDTWHSIGMAGTPTDYPYAVQKAAAQRLQARDGWGQWPACSRKLGLR